MAVSVGLESFDSDSTHRSEDLVKIFNDCFAGDWNTRLIPGGEEPVYLPAKDLSGCHRVVFTRDYFSSALHEIAHWCIAGSELRKHEDYGYWYTPDGRSAQQQSEFERVESRPQALEWVFSKACSRLFRVSLDNLNSPPDSAVSFKRAVLRDAQAYACNKLPERAEIFFKSLANYYGGPMSPSLLTFSIGEL